MGYLLTDKEIIEIEKPIAKRHHFEHGGFSEYGWECAHEQAQAQLAKAEPLIRKDERERIINELRDGGKLIISFIDMERDKRNDIALLITIKAMIHDLIEAQALKGEK